MLGEECRGTLFSVLVRSITPRACARGKVISRAVVVVVVVVSTKIAISRDLGTCAIHKHKELVEFDEKLASVYFKPIDTIYERQK